MDMEQVIAAYNAGHSHRVIQDYFDANELGQAPRPPIERGWNKAPIGLDEPWIEEGPAPTPTGFPSPKASPNSPGVLTDTEHLPWNRSSVIGSDDSPTTRIIEPNSQEDVITNAVKNGASWEDVSNYVGVTQTDNGTDQLINTKIDSGIPSTDEQLSGDLGGGT